MDNRRGPRFVIDPKIRQVGFVTPGSESTNPNLNPDSASAAIPSNPNPYSDSPSPVIIPPRVPDPPSKASPLPVPSPPPGKQPSVEVPLQGSYNPADSVLGNSPVSSPLSNGRYTDLHSSEGPDLSPSYVSKVSFAVEGLSLKEDHIESPSASRFAAAGDFSSFKQQEQPPPPPPSLRVSTSAGSLPQPPLQTLPSADEQAPSKPLKERTTKAERRAKQEADREAKRAARENGVYDWQGRRQGLLHLAARVMSVGYALTLSPAENETSP